MTEYTANPHQDFKSLEDLSDFLDEANIHSNCVLRFFSTFKINTGAKRSINKQGILFCQQINQFTL